MNGFGYLLMLLLAALLNSSSATYPFSSGRCTTLGVSSSARLVNPCVGAVNYAYYLPPGVTPSILEKRARNALNNTMLLQMSTTCIQSVVQWTCAKIYLKCFPKIDLTNATSYNYAPYKALSQVYGIPFQRPCLSTCQSVGTNCAKIYLSLTGFSASLCTATYDYSYGDITAVKPMRYDASNDAVNKCFVPQATPVVGMSEAYSVSSTSPCSGFIDTILIPTANKLNVNFTIIQAPGTIQKVINTQMTTQFATIPAFVPTSCYKALIRYQCSIYFPKPKKHTLLQALIYGGLTSVQATTVAATTLGTQLALSSSSFIVPEFHALSICQDYATKCAKLLPQLVARNPALAPNCSALVSGTTYGTRQFPTTNQTVNLLSVATGVTLPTGPPSLTFRFKSGPAPIYYNETQLAPLVSSYSPSCPKGFVIPEHPNHANNVDVTGTACAMACISPLWEESEWDSFHKGQVAFPIVGAICAITLMIFLVITQSLKETYILFLFAVFSFVASASSIQLAQSSLQDAFCWDNAINKMQHDDQEGSDTTPCVIQGAILVYTYFAGCCCSVMIVFDWRLKYYPKLYKTLHSAKYRIYYYGTQFLCCVVFSLIPMLYSYINKLLGFSRTQPWCFIRSYPSGPENTDIAVIAIPICILVGIYTIVFCWNDFCGLFASSSSSSSARLGMLNNEDGNNYPNAITSDEKGEEKNSVYAIAHTKAVHFALAMTVVVTLVIFVPFIASKGILIKERDSTFDSLTEWTQCVFKNYNAATPDSCFAVCGAHAEKRPSSNLVPIQLYCLTGNMLMLSPTYILSYLCAYIYQRTRKYARVDVDQRVMSNTKEIPVTTTPSSQRMGDSLLPVAEPVTPTENQIEMV